MCLCVVFAQLGLYNSIWDASVGLIIGSEAPNGVKLDITNPDKISYIHNATGRVFLVTILFRLFSGERSYSHFTCQRQDGGVYVNKLGKVEFCHI